jgi:hypothetical protein
MSDIQNVSALASIDCVPPLVPSQTVLTIGTLKGVPHPHLDPKIAHVGGMLFANNLLPTALAAGGVSIKNFDSCNGALPEIRAPFTKPKQRHKTPSGLMQYKIPIHT